MDEIDPQSARLNQQKSSIPRPSKLPLPRSSRLPVPGRTSSGNTLRSQQSQSSLRQPASRGPNPISVHPVATQSFSKSVNSAQIYSGSSKRNEDDIFKKPTSRPTSRDKDMTSAVILDESVPETEDLTGIGKPAKRRPRPSLLDRTIETLSQIPPSPAARRKSSFQVTDSPIRPSSRPASALSNSRPGSAYGSRPSSPTKSSAVPSVPRIPAAFSRSQYAGQDEQKSFAPRVAAAPKPKPTTQTTRSAMPLSTSASRAKATSTTRTTATRQSTTKPASASNTATSMGKAGSPGSKSSTALRESIAKAKAAAVSRGTKPRVAGGMGSSFMSEDPDPFQPRSGSPKSSAGLLRKRIQAARTDGYLNIAAMGLKQIPDEVMKMYDFDPTAASDWAETVDLTKLIAADNEIEELREDAFPDLSIEDVVESDEDINFQFAGLETMDMHGNLLRQLPMGFRRLQRIQILNLASNNLGNDTLEIISMILSLKELNLSSNKLDGSLHSSIGNLANLQSLNLRGNRIMDIPDSISALTQLRKLDVCNNMLQSLSIETIASLPLSELNVSKNKLEGILFSFPVSMPHLLILDISQNALEQLGPEEGIDLPRLQSLRGDGNRLLALPKLVGWSELRVLTVSENALTAFPSDLAKLNSIRTVDLSNNNITKIDPQVAFMDDLVSLSLNGNPLRERKYLTMSAADLKQDLRKKFEPTGEIDNSDEPDASEAIGNVASDSAISSSYTIKNGILDLSSKGLTEIKLDLLPPDATIKELRLSGNRLKSYPTELFVMHAETLRIIDLSSNPLGSSLPSQPISFPHLSSLNLSSSNLSTLDILSNLDAPNLKDLDISINALTGEVPPLRSTRFPSLTTLNASDNKFTTLPVQSARGLQSINLQNNDLTALEPRLGLLREIGTLQVRGNRFRVPRWDVLDKGTGALMQWLRARVPEGEGLDEVHVEEEEDDMF